MGLTTAVFVFLLGVCAKEASGLYCYRQTTGYYSCTNQALTYYSSSYTVSCGFFHWQRCTRYRQSSRYIRTYQVCTRYIRETVCCPGWSGPGCSIHDQSPIVEYCPPDKNVTAIGRGNTYVYWDRPRFRDPENSPLVITSTHNGESASLSWGVHAIRYTARSTNNNKESHCNFNVNVKPPIPIPEIQGHRDGEVIELQEGQQMTFLCFAEYGEPAMNLTWYMDDTMIDVGARFYLENSDHEHYINSFNELIFTLHRSHAILECRGWQPTHPLTRKVTLYFNIDHDLPPAVHYCPPDQEITTEVGNTIASWNSPIFHDHKGEELVVSCNLPGVNETYTTYKFTWGDNRVVYTARNPRSDLESTCEFVIQVQTKPCQPLLTPIGGALVCGTWSDGNTKICTYMCEDRYDIQLTKYVPRFFVCSSAGKWLPSPQTVSCTRERLPNRDKMPSSKHYYTGDCDLSRVKDNMKNATIDIIQNSIINSVCKFETCSLDHLTVNC